jgi:hypothetical protein
VEVKAEPKPTPKRSRAISGEVFIIKRFVIHLKAKALEEGPATEEDLVEGASEVPNNNEVAAN